MFYQAGENIIWFIPLHYQWLLRKSVHHIFQTNFYNEIMFIKRYETYNSFIDSILVPNAFLPTKNFEGYVLFLS